MQEEKKSTTTVKVITRHCEVCREEHPDWGQSKHECACRKYLYIYKDGKDRVISAKTRSFDKAEALAKELRHFHDPVQKELREIEQREAAKLAAEAAAQAAKRLTIVQATDRWLNAQKGSEQGTSRHRRRVVSRIQSWAQDNNIETVADVTADNLDKWRGNWNPDAEKPYDRMELTTQSRFQKSLKSVFRYVTELGYLEKDPAAGLKHIKAEDKHAQPLSEIQFASLIGAIGLFCGATTSASCSSLASEFDALFFFQRYSGLRIGDAVAFPRSGLVGNRITLTTQKTNTLIKDRIIPDIVANKLAALSENRPGFQKSHFFWFSGASHVESLVSRWEHKIGKLSDVLSFEDESGKPMRFHTHMLRYTYAVSLLLQGMSLEDVSKLLTHESIKTTEKVYAPWVKSRRERLEGTLVDAMRRMGKVVSTNGSPQPCAPSEVQASAREVCLDDRQAIATQIWATGLVDRTAVRTLFEKLRRGRLLVSEGQFVLDLDPAADRLLQSASGIR